MKKLLSVAFLATIFLTACSTPKAPTANDEPKSWNNEPLPLLKQLNTNEPIAHWKRNNTAQPKAVRIGTSENASKRRIKPME